MKQTEEILLTDDDESDLDEAWRSLEEEDEKASLVAEILCAVLDEDAVEGMIEEKSVEAWLKCGGPGSGIPGPCPGGNSATAEPEETGGGSSGGMASPKTAALVEHHQEAAVDRGQQKIADFVNSDAWDGPKGPEGEKMVRDKLAAAYDKAEVTVNFPPEVAGKIIASGALKSAFETGSRDAGYMAAREKQEGVVFGAGKETPAGDRPKYAAVNWENDLNGAASQYGEASFVLNKEAFAGKTTMTSGNSFGHRDPSGVATPADPFAAMIGNGRAMNAAGIDSSKMTDANQYAYNEQQIWGDMKLDKDTVKEIRVPATSALKEGSARLAEFAEKNGIPIRFYHETTGERMTFEAAKERAAAAYEASRNATLAGKLKKWLFG